MWKKLDVQNVLNLGLTFLFVLFLDRQTIRFYLLSQRGAFHESVYMFNEGILVNFMHDISKLGEGEYESSIQGQQNEAAISQWPKLFSSLLSNVSLFCF